VTEQDSFEILELARAAARAGAAEAISRLGTARLLRSKSSPTDPVSEADEASEVAIRQAILAARPDDAIVGEEAGESSGSSELVWTVDPIDGTVNYLYGYPQWCVSVGVADAEGPLAGVVLDPLRDEEFSAVRGSAAMLNGEPFERLIPEASGSDPLSGVLLATGFHYEASVRQLQGEVFKGLIPRVRDIRRGGSAALDLCWTAIGRVDAYAEHGVRAWDVAAAALICSCAGLDLLVLPAAGGWPTGFVAAGQQVAAELAAAWGHAEDFGRWPQVAVY
jgi:myo-inositol-1(or 4)-monophosphatase